MSRTQAGRASADARIARNLATRVNVGDLLSRSAARTPGREALVDGPRRYRYDELEAWCNRTAHGLLALGYAGGDALALMADNSAEFLVTYFACAKIGVVCVPVNLFWRQGELAHVLRHARVRGAVVAAERHAQLLAGLEPAAGLRELIVIGAGQQFPAPPPGIVLRWFDELAQGQRDDPPAVAVADRAPLTYLYTSGTSAAPKGVVGSHLAIYLESLGTAIDARMHAQDRVLAMMPLFHTAQLNAICTPVVAVGGTICVMKSFDADALLELIERERLSVLFALPMMYRALVEAQRARPRDLGSLRLAVYAMAPMPDELLRAALETLACDFSLMFGQTEMSPVATFFRPEHQLSHAGAVGTPATNVQVAIMDPSGRPLDSGVEGEIVYRSPQLLSGYLRDPRATREALRHGWFHSGDMGLIDGDGIVWFKDRLKDIIKSGGENIASIEVERAILDCAPGIAEVVVIGLPHPRWTEAVTAVVVPRPGVAWDEAAVGARMRRLLSPYKCPKSFIVAAELPRTATGKIRKAVLRDRYADYYQNAPSGQD